MTNPEAAAPTDMETALRDAQAAVEAAPGWLAPESVLRLARCLLASSAEVAALRERVAARPSPSQRAMMVHATGGRAGSHRNYYVTSTENYAAWEALAAAGLAVHEDGKKFVFCVTTQGLDYLYGVTRKVRDGEPLGDHIKAVERCIADHEATIRADERARVVRALCHRAEEMGEDHAMSEVEEAFSGTPLAVSAALDFAAKWLAFHLGALPKSGAADEPHCTCDDMERQLPYHADNCPMYGYEDEWEPNGEPRAAAPSSEPVERDPDVDGNGDCTVCEEERAECSCLRCEFCSTVANEENWRVCGDCMSTFQRYWDTERAARTKAAPKDGSK